jgi:transcriptional regulator with XRE-family HTH domain
MVIPGEIEGEESLWGATVEAFGAYAVADSREAACESLATTVAELGDFYGIAGLEVTVTHDGEATLYLTANDSRRLLALLLRCQRSTNAMSLADATAELGAKSRNSYAQYEQGTIDPSITKLQELLDAVGPDFVVAVIPRTARVIPRWHEEMGADVIAAIDAALLDPSEENIAALQATGRPPTKRKATR